MGMKGGVLLVVRVLVLGPALVLVLVTLGKQLHQRIMQLV